MAFLHSSQLLYTECGYPRWTVCFTMPNAIFFYFLFNNFYQKSYTPPDNRSGSVKAKQKALNDNNNNDNCNNNNNDSNNNECKTNQDLNKKQS